MSGAPLHGAAVSHAGGCLLILGRSGAGKSTLALEMAGLGAGMVADDLVVLSPVKGALVASPLHLGATVLVEVRGLGLLRLPAAPPAPLRLVLDLDREEEGRLPPRRSWTYAGVSVPLLFRPARLLAAALFLALAAGGPEDPEAPLPLR